MSGCACVECVQQSDAAVVEKWGGFSHTLGPGMNFVLWPMYEVAGTLSLKRSGDGMQYCAAAYACYSVSLGLFSVVLHHIPLSIAYATWCTVGTVLVSVMSQWLYGETISAYKWVCIGCTVPCVVGMHVLP